jgi:hypothetical protein
MDANGFLAQLDQHIVACINAMREGLDVPPATRYRLEGQIESAIALGLIERAVIQAQIDAHYQALLGAVPERAARDACVRLPLRMQTAPVYPGTKS